MEKRLTQEPGSRPRTATWRLLVLWFALSLLWAPQALSRELTARSVVWREPRSILPVQQTRTGHLLVRATVDARESGWFLLDSGSGAKAVDLSLARRLRLNVVGSGFYRGVADQLLPCTECQGRSLEVGAMALEKPRFLAFDLTLLSERLGQTILGILGYDLFFASVVEIALELGLVVLHDPARFDLPAGDWEGMVLFQRTPFVRASYEGQQGIFRIDLGAPEDTVTFHTGVSRDLLKTRATTTARLLGSGGSQLVRRGRIREFRLAGQVFTGPSVHFAVSEGGAFADDHTAGNIGGRFLQDFRIFFDYRNARICFVKHSRGSE